MSPQSDDRELGDFLARRSPVSREYSALGAQMPPAALDAQILAEAAAAARPKARPRRPPWWWLRPAALAATVLLSLSLVLRLGELPAPSRSANDETAVPVTVLPPAMKEQEQREQPKAQSVPPAPVATAETHMNKPQSPPRALGAFAEPDVADSAIMAAPRESARGLATAELSKQKFAADTAARPALTPDAVKRILEAIEARLAPAQPQEASAADARLREILALGKAGREEEIVAALAQFARDFPGDPISALVRAPAE